ncbi:CLUMA_CG014693, isoform A [Clunio marinus]|uniref:CLUMA_CG014693, isoform A n=1 Tax=Clunio marinus TaxID=568069 RepID=A0A1J1IN12_9DIPT|nr:CLUMA_CG014693, isoform A [Clunio marinus]
MNKLIKEISSSAVLFYVSKYFTKALQQIINLLNNDIKHENDIRENKLLDCFHRDNDSCRQANEA